MATYGPYTVLLNYAGWTDTGVDVPSGTIPFTATGVGTWNGVDPAYPNGAPGWPSLPFPIPGTPLADVSVPFCLVVKISSTPPGPNEPGCTVGGADGVPFDVVSPGGRLYLGFNDILPGGGDPYADNTGQFEVTFTLEGGGGGGPFENIFNGPLGEDLPEMTRYLDDVVPVTLQASNGMGAATDATGSPTYRVYEQLTDTPILNGMLAKVDDSNTTGFYGASFTASVANGFEVGKTYTVRAAATVDAVDQAGIIDRFVIRDSIGDSVWLATLASDAAGAPTTFGGALKRILSKLQNRMNKSGNVVRLYADDNATVIATSQYSLTDTGFDRPKDS